MQQHYPFVLPPPPYPFDALTPFLDTETVKTHYTKHYQNYIDALNLTLLQFPAYQQASLPELLTDSSLPGQLRHSVLTNGGGIFNHAYYFAGLTPASQSVFPENSRLKQQIIRQYGSLAKWAEAMTQSAMSVFGSGWAWLAAAPDGSLRIISTQNQDTVLPFSLCPILPVDVWEHAYYLKYKNMRAEYLKNWLSIINWKQAETNYLRCLK